MKTENVLVIGANGQIGSVLVNYLRDIYGADHVLATDIRAIDQAEGLFEVLDATDAQAIARLVDKFQISQIYHLAAILSANGEKLPLQTWDINMKTYFNVLEVAREKGIKKLFYPSSIAVFGSDVSKCAFQNSPLNPTTVYGISKVAGENWSVYYHRKYGLDVRSLRYPGIISHQSAPGGGTTDYAVDIYHKAVNGAVFECFLKPETVLPMIYINDAMDATIRLMETDSENITVRSSYNLAGMSFSPSEIVESIRKQIPNFEVVYQPDFRQAIADSWPKLIEDKLAREDWSWKPQYDLDKTTTEMIAALQQKYQVLEK